MLIIVVLILLHISVTLGLDRRNLVSPLNALLVLVWVMVIRATELTILGESIYPEWVRPYMSESIILESSLVVALFLACFLPSYLLVSVFLLDENNKHGYMRQEVELPKIVILGMGAIGTTCAIYFFSQLNDLTDIILHKTKEEVFEGNGLLIAGISLLPAAVLGALMSCRTKGGLLIVSALLFLTSSAVYIPLGQRGNIFTFVIIALVACIAKLGKISLKWAVTAGIVVLFCLELAVIWRTTLRYGYEGSLFDFFVVASELEGVDRGEFDALAGLVAYNASIDFDSWWDFTEQLIPRALIPSKNEYTPVSYLVNRETIGYTDAGFTASIIGTLFAQGGWAGVAVAGVIFGILMRLVQWWFTAESRTQNGVLLRGLTLVFVFFLSRNGDLTNVLVMLIANLAGVFLLMGMLSFLPIWRRTWKPKSGRDTFLATAVTEK